MTTVALGGREYTLRPLGLREAVAWRTALETALGPVFGASGAPQIGQIGEAVRAVAASVTPNAMVEFVLGWADDLDEDRERILDTSNDAEIAEAFSACLDLAYPFRSSPTQAGRSASGHPPALPGLTA